MQDRKKQYCSLFTVQDCERRASSCLVIRRGCTRICLLFPRDQNCSHHKQQRLVTDEQALTGSRISIPGFFGTGFCKIPGSRDFSGRDFPIFLIPGFKGNFSGYFGIFIFASFPCQIRSLLSNQYPENDQNSISERSSTLKQHALKNYQSDQYCNVRQFSLLLFSKTPQTRQTPSPPDLQRTSLICSRSLNSDFGVE